MKISFYIVFQMLFIFVGANLWSQEILHPSGYNIQSQYDIPEKIIDITDTLSIQRQILNNENFDLTGLYFMENLPEEFEVVYYSITINGSDIDHEYIGPVANHEVNGFETYFWVVDSPAGEPGVNNSINPGDIIRLEIKIINDAKGLFSLPAHASVFYGNSAGFFSTSDTENVEFISSADVDDDGDIIIPDDYLIASAYPNPFNGSVTIKYSGVLKIRHEVSLEICNILGQEVYSDSFSGYGNQGMVQWEPDQYFISGIHLYRLSIDGEYVSGKLVLIK